MMSLGTVVHHDQRTLGRPRRPTRRSAAFDARTCPWWRWPGGSASQGHRAGASRSDDARRHHRRVRSRPRRRRCGFRRARFTTLEIAQGSDDQILAGLADIGEVLEVHAVTGPGDLHLRVVARSNEHLHDVLQRILSCPASCARRPNSRCTPRSTAASPTSSRVIGDRGRRVGQGSRRTELVSPSPLTSVSVSGSQNQVPSSVRYLNW